MEHLWGQFQQRQAQKQAAADNMDTQMSQHSGDGAISVGDMGSANQQVADIKTKLNQIDQDQTIKGK